MSLSFAELVQPSVKADIETAILSVLQIAGFPVTAWQSGGAPRNVVQSFATVLEEAWFTVAKVAKAGVIARGYSSGAWLDQAALSQYNEPRKLAASTVQLVRLTDNGGGPYVLTVGGLVVGTVGGLQYRCSALPNGATLALNGVLDVEVTAVAPALKYNVAVGAINQMVTTLPTVTVTNIVGATTLGADVESDNNFIDRLPLKWATLSTGSPVPAYKFWALTQGVGVNRARVDDGAPGGPSTIYIYIDSPSAVATVQAYIQPASGYGKAPAGARVTVFATTARTIAVGATVTVAAGTKVASTASIVANLSGLALAQDIGSIVRQADVIEAIMRELNAIDVVFSGVWPGLPNVALGASEVPSFDLTPLVIVEG